MKTHGTPGCSKRGDLYKPNLRYQQWRIQDFPEEGAPASQGVSTYDFAKISQKLHKIERIWARGGRVSLAPPLDSPITKAK